MSKEKQCKCCKEYWWEMNIHSQSGLCPNCYDYVSDLEAKLAEKDVELNKWSTEYARAYVNRQNDLIAENVELKRQIAELQGCGLRASSNHNLEIQNAQACVKKLEAKLAEKEKEIANREKILVLELKSTIEYIEHCEELKYHNGLKNIKNHFLEHLKGYENGNFEIIDKYHNQEKIKFAIAELEKVKELVKENESWEIEGSDYSIVYADDVLDQIDNQIKQLKEMKQDERKEF